MVNGSTSQSGVPVLGINSLGRIGKLTLWHHIGRKYFKEIVINLGRDVGSGLDTIAQLIEKDATYGLMHRFLYGVRAQRLIQITDEKNGKMVIDGIPVTVLREERNPMNIPWRQYGADMVVDCSGTFKDPTVAVDDKKGSIRGHLQAGARVVVHSAPFKIKSKATPTPEDTTTLIYGINHTAFNPKKHTLVSAASCTTTGLAHMVKPLLDNEETSTILTASMSTIHAVTNSQSVLDKMPKAGEKDIRKTRSILNNIILTSTGAASALADVIPEVKNIGFMGDSIRVPTTTLSLIILNATFQARKSAKGAGASIDTQTINEIYRKAAESNPEKIVKFTMEQNVSTDLIGEDAAVVIEGQFNHTRTAFIPVDLSHIPDLPANVASALGQATLQVPVVHAKIFGWYDNEYGSYTNRMADLTVYIHKNLL